MQSRLPFAITETRAALNVGGCENGCGARLSVAYVPFIFVDAALISNRVLALVHMTLFVSAAKLFQTKRDRDWVFLYLIAFFQMLLAAGLTFDATFIASLALFLFFFISTLAAFEIRRSGREVTSLEEETVAPLKQQRIKYRGKPETAAQEPSRAISSRSVFGSDCNHRRARIAVFL